LTLSSLDQAQPETEQDCGQSDQAAAQKEDRERLHVGMAGVLEGIHGFAREAFQNLANPSVG
jgi:hypothetical protein